MAARIRTIKPELREHLPFAQLTDRAARLFVSLYTIVDDTGRAPASPAFLAGAVFFARPCAHNLIGRTLAELETADLIVRYEVKRAPFLEIVGWRVQGSVTHQRIDKPTPGRYPAPESVPSKNNSESTSETDSRTDRDRYQNRDLRERPDASERPLPAAWVPPDELRTKAISRGLVYERVLSKFRNHALANGLVSVDWDASFGLWVDREHTPALVASPSSRPSPRGDGKPRDGTAPEDAPDFRNDPRPPPPPLEIARRVKPTPPPMEIE